MNATIVMLSEAKHLLAATTTFWSTNATTTRSSICAICEICGFLHRVRIS
jgi:hypothetical protein